MTTRAPLLAALILSLSPLASEATAPATPPSPVVASVGGKPLTQAQLERLYDALSPDERASYRGPRAERLRQFLEEYLKRRPFMVAAERQGVHENESVMARLDLERSRILYEEYLRRHVLEQLFTPKEIEEAYRANLPQFSHPAAFHFRQITVTARRDERLQNNRADDAADAEQAQAKRGFIDGELANGTAFAELARGYSEDRFAREGGTVPFISAEELAGPFREVLAKTKTGERSAWFGSEYGWHLIEVISRDEAGAYPLATVKPQVLGLLAERQPERIRKAVEDLRQRLTRELVVESFPERIE